MNSLKNKIRSVVLGHAVGDALGVPVEFRSRSELEEKPVTNMLGYGTYPVPAGSWSDDTSMSLAALDSLASGKLDFSDVMLRFGKWYYEAEYTPTGEVFDVGNTCRFAIENYFTRKTTAEKYSLCNEHSNGNGSLMRIHPFSLITKYNTALNSQWEAIIEKASALTHGHERAILGCKIYTQVLHRLLDAPRKEAIKLALITASRSYSRFHEFACYDRLFSPNFHHISCEEIKSSGYVVDSLEAAIWCLLTTNSYTECVLKAVNLGEDTDTVAAIAGGLAGALYGYESIPKEWLNVLKRREYIEAMCDITCKAWF